MKRLWGLALCLYVLVLVVCPALARMNVATTVGGGAPAAGGDCPAAGTYDYYWNGDHSSGTTYVCYDDGADINGTLSGASINSGGYSGNKFDATEHNQHLYWSGTIDVNKGVIWVLFSTSDTSRTGNIYFMETHDAVNSEFVRVYVETDDTVSAVYDGGGASETCSSTGTIAEDGSWQWLGYSWDIANDDHAVYVNGAWEDCNDEGFTVLTATAHIFALGEKLAGSSFTETYALDNYYYIPNTYKPAVPFGL